MQDVIDRIHDYSLEEIMGERFGRYAKTIIQDRAIPDVRDGLKPVQRRILYCMYKDHNTYDKPTRKCAKTVGNVMGNFHPHGDSSIYEAMVRMSQWWKQNTPYIYIQGNNGSMDGDPAAASRYTEARLEKISNELLKDIDKGTVKWTPNYDDTEYEPTVLPAKFPNLLVNGANGISAGYATNIPTHNLGEIIDATIKRIESPNCRLDTILEIVKGPDFPTGGVVEGKDGIIESFTSGKGKIIVKSKIEFKKAKGKDQMIISEIPFDVNKALLVKKMDEIRIDKKIEGISEVRDESDKDGLSIVIDFKPNANKELILNYLLKNTELQISYAYNMVAIVNRRPMVLGILPILDAYIDHQREVITKRTEFDLALYKKDLHITEGLVKALSILDEVIATIRASKNKLDAKENLVKKYDFTMEQADAIVMLQLYKLTNTDVTELESKLAELKKYISALESILADPEKLKEVMKYELKKIKKEYAIPRRTEIKDTITEIKIEQKDLITKENVMVVVSNEGYIKRTSMKSYASSEELPGLKVGDYVIGKFELNTLDNIIIFTNFGNYIALSVHQIYDAKWKELGKHLSNLVPLSEGEKVIKALLPNNKDLVLFTKNGLVKRLEDKLLVPSRVKKLMTAIKLKTNDELVSVSTCYKNALSISYNGFYLLFDSNQIPITGLKSSGVKGMNLKDDYLINGLSYESKEYLNIFTNNKTAKRIKTNDLESLNRAKKGYRLLKNIKANPYYVIAAYLSNSKDEFGLKKDEDIEIIKNSDISIMDLQSTGSILTKKTITSVFKVVEITKSDNFKKEPKESLEETITNHEPGEIEELTIDDFISDFKL